MRARFVVLLTAGIASLVLAGFAGGASGGHDFTSGAGKILVGGAEQQLSFTAHCPTEVSPCLNASGHAVFKSAALDLKGHTRCLWVIANRAFFTIDIEDSSNPALVGLQAAFDVVDNDGLPGNVPDQLLLEFTLPFTGCLPPLFSGLPMTSGNVVVTDAS